MHTLEHFLFGVPIGIGGLYICAQGVKIVAYHYSQWCIRTMMKLLDLEGVSSLDVEKELSACKWERQGLGRLVSGNRHSRIAHENFCREAFCELAPLLEPDEYIN